MTATPTRQAPTESELLRLFDAHEELEEGPAQELQAGGLGPLNALVPDGAGDVRIAANTCTVVELRRAAALDELRDQDERHCASEGLDASFLAEPALRENGELGTVFTVGKGEAPSP